MTVEVLFEYLGYRCIICTHKSKICEEVKRHLQTSGVDHNPRVVIASLSPQSASSDTVYFLQRWNPKWESFVNVESLNDIKKEDRLTVVKALSNPEVSYFYRPGRAIAHYTFHKLYR